MPSSRDTDFSPVEIALRDGRRVILRNVMAQDREKMRSALQALSAESRYSRFMAALREPTPQMLERATRPDPQRELQLVAVAGEGDEQRIVGGARYGAGAQSKECEFAVTVVDDWQGQGLARELLKALMGAARARGFERMEGFILASNARMLALANRLGFLPAESPEGPSVQRVVCDLTRLG
ncbi:MAG TPA: GNAT family N-acetyltransferase [Burkholderiaceae bacterium]|nr:GNAT family N-acetyltransferase [Burkholderiaceae bacterium]